jgi:RNA polymerase sigma factor (TIGR02999 family)
VVFQDFEEPVMLSGRATEGVSAEVHLEIVVFGGYHGKVMTDITLIQSAGARGDPRAAEQLLPLVYDELRRLASQKLAIEKPGQTLDATALVHEAYLRLVGGGKSVDWDSRGHFFAAAAEAMRRILVEQARRKSRKKHGGGLARVDLEDAATSPGDVDLELLAVDEALTRLAAMHPEKAALVKLRYFVGLTMDQAATALGVSPATADRHWAYARAWLHREMSTTRDA